MADIKQAIGTSTGITITLAGLTDGSARESTFVDNATNLFLDAMVHLNILLATGTPASDKAINIYVYGSEDATDYTDNATGTDAAITLRDPTNLKLVQVISTPDLGALTYKSHPFSIGGAFGGVMPRRWGIVVENKTGLAFGTGEANFVKEFSGIFATN